VLEMEVYLTFLVFQSLKVWVLVILKFKSIVG
jgi:hypothetical protein